MIPPPVPLTTRRRQYDQIALLEEGVLAEFGPPAGLLDNPDGLFTKLVDGTGAMAPHLKAMARSQAPSTVGTKKADDR